VRTLVDEPACLLIADIDNFKHVNDRHGHTVGDATLEAVARELSRSFPRRSDVVARFGGDEFAIILRDATGVDGGRLAARFLEAVRQLEVSGPHGEVPVTASVGVAEALPGELADNWFARADRALYAAKAEGRDCVVIAGDEPAGSVQFAA
jgi:diguanylate cyclase (GGDEF)-like protein